jgi:hypothetical protein
MSAGSIAVVTARAAAGDARRIGVLFMIGSGCFAIASLPGASDVNAEITGSVYFAGSIFFTVAAFEQLRTARGDRYGFAAAAIQFVGTILFNVSTFVGMRDAFGPGHHELLVWPSDAWGSVAFLISSGIAAVAARGEALVVRRSAAWNLAGSVAFGLSAIAGYIVPDTGDLLDASLATSTTLIGALCFMWAARLLVKPPLRLERA